MTAERARKEEEEATQKERKVALRGVITCAKKVQKELLMSSDVFSDR